MRSGVSQHNHLGPAVLHDVVGGEVLRDAAPFVKVAHADASRLADPCRQVRAVLVEPANDWQEQCAAGGARNDFDSVDLALPRSDARRPRGRVRIANRAGGAAKVPRRTHLLILAILAALSIASCCPAPRVIRQPVIVTPPPCLTRPAPQVDPSVEVFGAEWADYYVELTRWVVEVERACSATTSDAPNRAESVGAVGHYGADP